MVGFEYLTSYIRCFHFQLYVIVAEPLFRHFLQFVESLLTVTGFVSARLRHSAHPVEFRTVKVVGSFYFHTFSVYPFLSLFEVIAIISFILIHLPIVYFDNFRTDTVEEITVVSHHQQTEIGTAKIIFEPFGHIQIQMVGRLVKNQQLRFGNQCICQSYTLQLPTGKLLHLLVKVTNLKLRKDLLRFLLILPRFLMVHTNQKILQSRMSFRFHTTLVFFYQLNGTVAMMETGFQHG